MLSPEGERQHIMNYYFSRWVHTLNRMWHAKWQSCRFLGSGCWVCLAKEGWMWRGWSSLQQTVSSRVDKIKVLKKVNNAECMGQFSSWYHIPSENRPFSLFMASSGWQVHCCCCAILTTQRTEGRNVHITCHAAVQWLFCSFMFLPNLPGKIQSSLFPQFFCPPQTERKRERTWFDLQRRERIWFERVLIWFGEKQTGGENVKDSTGTITTAASEEQGNTAFTGVYIIWFYLRVFHLQQCHKEEVKKENLTSLVKQCTQTGAPPASESSLSSSWISGWTSDRWQPAQLCFKHTLAHLPDSKRGLTRKKIYTLHKHLS